MLAVSAEINHGELEASDYIPYHTRLPLEGVLYPFQEQGVKELLERPHTLLLDEMGLGKTIEAIATVLRTDSAHLVLVICPLALVSNWKREIRKWSGGNSVYDKTQYVEMALDAMKGNRVWFILNQDYLSKDDNAESIALVEWDIAIVDEFHMERNAKAKRTIGLMKMRAKKWLFLSGSPIVNQPQDLYPALHLIDPKRFSNPKVFDNEYLIMGTRTPWGKTRVLGPKAALRAYIQPITTRRLKKDVLPELPDKVNQTLPLEMGEVQRKMYDAIESIGMLLLGEDQEERDVTLTIQGIFAFLTRLRQAAVDPSIIETADEFNVVHHMTDVPSVKTDALMQIISETLPEQLVIFCTFEGYITRLGERLARQKTPYVRLTGKENTHQRDANVAAFQRGDVPLLLATIKTGGTGLNLQAASRVVFVDKWWTNADNIQAEDRLHRIGQTASVQVISLVADDSIDEFLASVLAEKAAIAGEILGEESMTNATRVFEMLKDRRMQKRARGY